MNNTKTNPDFGILKVFIDLIEGAMLNDAKGIGWVVKENLFENLQHKYSENSGKFNHHEIWRKFFVDLDAAFKNIVNPRFIEKFDEKSGDNVYGRIKDELLGRWSEVTTHRSKKIAYAAYLYAHTCLESKYSNSANQIDVAILGAPFVDIFGAPMPLTTKEANELKSMQVTVPDRSSGNLSTLSPSYPIGIKLDGSYQKGRDEFELTKTALISKDTKSVALTAAIFGAGGYGKTALAEEICLDEDIRKTFPGGIYWLQLGMVESDDKSAKAQFVSIDQAVDRMVRKQYLDQGEIRKKITSIETLFEKLPEEQILIIADDVWNHTQHSWNDDLPSHITALITTRNKLIATKSAVNIEIEHLTPKAAFKLLTDGMDTLSKDQKAQLKSVCEGFKGWPLLIKLANAQFKQQYSLGEPLGRIIDSYREFLNDGDITGWDVEGVDNEVAQEKRRKLVGYSIQAGIDAFSNDLESELLLTLGVFPDDTDIPFSVVSDFWVELTKKRAKRVGRQKAMTCLQTFNSLSFFRLYKLEDDVETSTFQLHDEILAYFRQSHKLKGLELLHNYLAASINSRCSDEWPSLPKRHHYGWKHILHHLEQAGQADVANNLRTNFFWIKNKLEFLGITELIRSYLTPVMSEDARMIGNAIRQSANVLSHQSKALAHQIYGRLGHSPQGRIASVLKDAQENKHFWPKPTRPHLNNVEGEAIRLNGHSGLGNCASLNSEGDTFVTASSDCTAIIWDAVSMEQRLLIESHNKYVTDATFSTCGKHVVTASVDCTANISDIKTSEVYLSLVGHSDWVLSASFNKNDDSVVTASADGTALIWNAETGYIRQQLVGHNHWVLSASFNHMYDLVVTASIDKTARIWNTNTGDVFHVLRGHKGSVLSASFSAGGGRVITASYDKSARIWLTANGEELLTLLAHNNSVTGAAFDDSGDYIVTVSDDKTAIIWDSFIGEILAVVEFDSGIKSVKWNHQKIIVGLNNGQVSILSTEQMPNFFT